jgi:acyl-CoA synthetase (AMP-forming)/AMP-acid ligase II
MEALTDNLAALIAEKAARHPDRPAVVAYRRGRREQVTFGELEGRVAALAARLRGTDIGPGDRVLVFVPMSIDLYVTLLACLHAGAAAVFLDAWSDRRRLDVAVERANPSLFIGSPRAQLLRLVSPAVRRVPARWTAYPGFTAPCPKAKAAAPAPVGPDAPALITLTTGTTGVPKLAARSHGFLWAQHRAIAAYLRLCEEDVDMPTLPVFVLNNLALGVTSVLPDFDPRRPGEIDPRTIYRQMLAERVTTSSGSPSFYERLLEWCDARDIRLPLRAAFTGGAPVLPRLARLLRERIAGESHAVYGSTEAEPIAGIRVPELLEALEREPRGGLPAGNPVGGLSLRILRPHDGPIALGHGGWSAWEAAPGEAGEIVVAGEHVLGRYLDSAEADREQKIVDGPRVWHRTGDAGRIDAGGRLWLLGRLSQRVRRAGEAWWSQPAELAALSVPGVRRAAYLPVPPSGEEQRAVLCIETPDGRLPRSLECSLREAVEPAPVDECRAFKRLPRDLRHASRNDVAAIYARSFSTTLPNTSVRRKSRPWKR